MQLPANNAPVAQMPGLRSSMDASAAAEEDHVLACPAETPLPAGCTAEDPPSLSEAGPSEVENRQESDKEDEEQERLQQEVNTYALSL